MKYKVEFQNASSAQDVPSRFDFKRWIDAVLSRTCEDEAEVSLRIVDEAEMIELNQTYRKKQGPTNVLAFPFNGQPEIEPYFLGDLVICAPVVTREAQEQEKQVQDHWAHLIIHGSLHLLGYDHLSETDATAMEALEIEILDSLNIANPYQ